LEDCRIMWNMIGMLKKQIFWNYVSTAQIFI
jgi:hypothetical protein